MTNGNLNYWSLFGLIPYSKSQSCTQEAIASPHKIQRVKVALSRAIARERAERHHMLSKK
ncbi:hypothetical protein [Nostoc sp.]|uniref:hypothetical protein n=1 Tax=Nostoc sp. TaxID=1180 RepID=UPI002FF675B2